MVRHRKARKLRLYRRKSRGRYKRRKNKGSFKAVFAVCVVAVFLFSVLYAQAAGITNPNYNPSSGPSVSPSFMPTASPTYFPSGGGGGVTPSVSPVPSSSSLKMAANIYGLLWDESKAQYVASHFDLIVVDFENERRDFYLPYASWMARIKQLNPAIKIFGYIESAYIHTVYSGFEVVNVHEDWFLHDVTGNRITNNYWSVGTRSINGVQVYDNVYLMDVSNVGWRQYVANVANTQLSQYPQYDGAYLDDVWSQIRNMMQTDNSFSGFTLSSDVVTTWHSSVLGMLQYIKSNIASNKMLMINTEDGYGWDMLNNRYTSGDYISVVDGLQIEGYFHAPWEDASSYTKINLNAISFLRSASASGKIVFASSGCTTDDSRIQAFTFATYLLGVNGEKAYWGWGSGEANYYYNISVMHPDIMDTDIGVASGSYYQTQNVYMRDFSNGKVISNPSSSSQTVSLGASYRLLSGAVVSSVTLSAYSGEVLLYP